MRISDRRHAQAEAEALLELQLKLKSRLMRHASLFAPLWTNLQSCVCVCVCSSDCAFCLRHLSCSICKTILHTNCNSFAVEQLDVAVIDVVRMYVCMWHIETWLLLLLVHATP